VNTDNIDKSIKNEPPKKIKQIKMDFENSVSEWRHTPDGWQLPPLDVLTETFQNTNEKVNNEARARLIINTLSSFGVDAKVVEINEGPTVTQFGVEPGWDVKEKITTQLDSAGIQLIDKKGEPLYKKEIISRTRIRVNRITALQNDLALALATPSLRIEAPVPGKPIVGIEVPNSLNSIVNLKNLIDNQKFHSFKEKNNLPVALGQGVSGEPLLIDLTKMPHLLIAGATGSGKSVCLSGIISCLLMNHSPSELRFILIDPKRVELTQFAKIPHLAFSEIVVDTDKVVSTLRAVINEMENRYKRFGSLKVRNIQAYNEKFPDDPLPYWVVIVDELADLMLSASFEVETQLVRLAQLARATGIHLIIATQRPSVDVITGLIKANFPTRIAFAVTSQIDSRTIIDYAGAEKLLGRGDMLFLSPNAQKPKRIQGVYVDDSEIEKIVHFWNDEKFEEMKPEKQDHLIVEAAIANQEIKNNREHKTDDLYPDAITLISELETVSVSLLQRKLRIGYPRAARLMDELEENNKVSLAQKGQNLRKVIKGSSSNNLDNSKLEDDIPDSESNFQ
jgi:S-DNA-T family DNA segregation ATPase FtsK/SpoIIIE